MTSADQIDITAVNSMSLRTKLNFEFQWNFGWNSQVIRNSIKKSELIFQSLWLKASLNAFFPLLEQLFHSFVIHEISIFTLAKFIRLQMKMERKRKSRINLIFSGFQIYYRFFHMLFCLLNYIPLMNTKGVFFCCHL